MLFFYKVKNLIIIYDVAIDKLLVNFLSIEMKNS